ncbi:tetratricopeptide repeat protein [Gilvibacter sediminis]|uniref:tetratricopeptide repeat protein n=1 Tax=Gilvibacter sediminis TaxID=379071 RepID=UPI0023509E93|nr:hypothetical protein [Gilvibacter sediminis]MDC7996756.1 hypothetical protein [Gilvibacter sediminis]
MLIYLLLIFGSVVPGFAQDDDILADDLGNVSDAFQESFFEALKQKGIQNYEKALEALESAMSAAGSVTDQRAVVYYEMAKNHLALKQYEAAENALIESDSYLSGRKDVQELLYEVYHKTRDYEKAIPVVQKLISFDPVYKEDLANLYVRTARFDEAMELINELDQTVGRNAKRDELRKRVISITGDVSSEITRLEGITNSDAATEQDYLELIYRYSTEGDSDKAQEAANMLLTRFPESDLVHLALYKFALRDGEQDKAVSSMQQVLAADAIDASSKYKVLADFMDFVAENPNYEGALDEAITTFSSTVNSSALWQQLGDYFLSQDKREKALDFYQKGVAANNTDYSLLKNTLLLQIDAESYQAAFDLSETALEIYPAQALLYLLQGVSLMGLDKADSAIAILEEGVDYVIDDPALEKDFYDQLSKAYNLKGNSTKAAEYAKKAQDLGTP